MTVIRDHVPDVEPGYAAQKSSFGYAALHATCLFPTMEFDLLLQQPNEYQIV